MVAQCSLGRLLVAATVEGVCSVRLGSTVGALREELKQEFSSATLKRGGGELEEWVKAFVDFIDRQAPLPDLPHDVQATAFQRQVWDAIRAIPTGETATYGELATAIGQPKSARAVAQACASNPLALLVPCHRVVPKAGGSGGYRWGRERKEELLARERGAKR